MGSWINEGTLSNRVNADRRRRDGEGGQLSEDEWAELVRLRRALADLACFTATISGTLLQTADS